MAATVGGALASIINAALPAVPVTRDQPRSETPGNLPYITIQEGVSRARMPASAKGVVRNSELVQVDIWQQRNPNAEDTTIATKIEQALEAAAGVNLGTNGLLWRFYVEGSIRQPFDEKNRLVHEALTVRVTRSI